MLLEFQGNIQMSMDELFNKEKFLTVLSILLREIRMQLDSSNNKENIKNTLNKYYPYCLEKAKNKKEELYVHLGFCQILSAYGQKYQSVQTLENILHTLNNKDIKERMFSTFSYDAKMLYSQTLFFRFNLVKDSQDIIYKPDNLKSLIEVKYHLTKLYSQYIEGKLANLKTDKIGYTLELLSACYCQLNRWSETIYYSDLAKKYSTYSSNAFYFQAQTFKEIAEKTCLDYNGYLLLKIIDSCRNAYNCSISLPVQISQLQELEKATRQKAKKHNIKITALRKHKKQINYPSSANFQYIKFCSEKKLFLSEHSLFCECKASTSDDLSIQTSHLHTQIPWTKKFEKIINDLVFDFIIARKNYYSSLPSVPLEGYSVSLIKRNNKRKFVKYTLLKNTFKSFYSILDKIGYAIFQILDINAEDILKQKYPHPQSPPKLYFLNMWDHDLFTEENFKDNIYLSSLWSIAKDLDRTKHSGLKGFKTIRNALEHKMLLVFDDDIMYNDNFEKIHVEDLAQKTETLLILTKSAILSLVYLIRQKSIDLYDANKEH